MTRAAVLFDAICFIASLLHALTWTAVACGVVVMITFHMYATGDVACAIVFLFASSGSIVLSLLIATNCY